MATQLEVFRIVAPEFSTASDVTVQSFLDLAPLFIDPMLYSEESRGLALVYQAASLMLKQSQSASGESNGLDFTMKKEGDLTVQYGSRQSSNTGVTRDIYLQQLDTLSRQFAGATIMTRFGRSLIV